jgi:hypothetical protein
VLMEFRVDSTAIPGTSTGASSYSSDDWGSKFGRVGRSPLTRSTGSIVVLSMELSNESQYWKNGMELVHVQYCEVVGNSTSPVGNRILFTSSFRNLVTATTNFEKQILKPSLISSELIINPW